MGEFSLQDFNRSKRTLDYKKETLMAIFQTAEYQKSFCSMFRKYIRADCACEVSTGDLFEWIDQQESLNSFLFHKEAGVEYSVAE